MKRILYFGIISITALLVSCNSHPKHSEIAIIEHSESIDTISKDLLRFTDNTLDIKAIDIKMLDDSLYLYVIPDNPDQHVLFIFEFNNEDNSWWFQDSIQLKLDSEKLPHISGLSIISRDTIAVSDTNTFAIVNIRTNQQLAYLKLNHPIYTQSFCSPIQWYKNKNMLVTEYIDYSRPENKLGITETEIYACIDINKQKIQPIPIKTPNTNEIKSINYRWHFTLAQDRLICKHSIQNSFDVYDFTTNKISRKTFDIDESFKSTKDEDIKDYDKLRSSYFKSYIQSGLIYDTQKEVFGLVYLMPLPERDKTGKVPNQHSRQTMILLFDKQLECIGKINLAGDGFLSGLCFSNNGIISLVQTTTPLKIKTITYKLHE